MYRPPGWHHVGMTHTTDVHHRNHQRAALVAGPVVGLLLVLGGCSADAPPSDTSTPSSVSTGTSAEIEPDTMNADHPDVLAAMLEPDGTGSWSLDVTLSSQYDSPERYADGWRVLDADGTVLGEHTLTHDHADEQPFTRTQSGLEIPDGVDVITVQGKDTENGYGGQTLEVEVSR